ncbi:MAG: hypothetical protein ABIR66_07000 [Saprospiraceae bacterium]
MMKFIAGLVMVFLFFTCSKDKLQSGLSLTNDALESRKSTSIILCHIDSRGEYRAMTVNIHALPAHLAHGDYLPDADEDGYTAIGSCTGSKDDCDDHDPEVNPGNNLCTDCGCFNLQSINSSDLLFYYNSDNNPCGIYDNGEGVILFYKVGDDTLVVAAGVEEDMVKLVGRSVVVDGIVIKPNTDNCLQLVGVGITLSQYETCIAGLRSIIENHPSLQNICDVDNPPILEDTNPFHTEKSTTK